MLKDCQGMAVSSLEMPGSALPNSTLPGTAFPTLRPRTLPPARGPAPCPVGAGLCVPGVPAPYLALGWLCPDLGAAGPELPVFPSPYMERLLGEAGG